MPESYPYAAMLGRVMHDLKDEPVLLALVLKDPVLGEWWAKRRKTEENRVIAEAEKKRIANEKIRLGIIKTDLLTKLTDDEKKALGLVPKNSVSATKAVRKSKRLSSSQSINPFVKNWASLNIDESYF